MGQNRPTSFMMKNKTLDLTKGNTITVLVYFVLPILLGSLIQQLYVTADAVIVGQFVGKNGLAADAMAPALTTFTAQNIGAGKYDRVKKGVFVGVAMSTICCIMISIVLFFGTPIMGKWFLTSSDAGVIVPLASGYMRLLAPFFFFYAIAEALSGACSSMGDTLKPMLVTLTCMCVLRIVGIIFVFPLHHTMECIAFIYIASWVVTATAFVLMFVIRLRMLEIKKNKKRAFVF